MLDIVDIQSKGLLPTKSPLSFLGRSCLVEMYAATTRVAEYSPSEILIRGAFVDSEEIGNAWKVIGHQRVSPQEVEFPESIIGYMHPSGETAFECGEIDIPLPFNHHFLDAVNAFKSQYSASLWPDICLQMLSHKNQASEEYKMPSVANCDLRYSKYRSAIYKHLPFHKEASYFDKQKSLGLEIERFYC